jgi:renalase
MTEASPEAPAPSAAGDQAPIIVVGGGLSGIACARRLHDEGRRVVVLERARALGGRMAVRTEHLAAGAHAVDTGAPYFTVRDEGFSAVVQRWSDLGLASGWTDTFILSTPSGRIGATTSPVRWSARHGIRSLVENLASGLDVRLEHPVTQVRVAPGAADRRAAPLTVDGEPAAAVVLAMPDPQAERLLTPELAARLEVAGRAWAPTLTVWAAWPERWWPGFDAMFVDGSRLVSWVADDGRSRGDDAAVLVAHTTGEYAAAHLDDVQAVIGPVLEELPRVIGSGVQPEPIFARVHRWSLASSRHPHEQDYALVSAAPGPGGAGLIGVCGDGWGERSRVEQAWSSGDRLATALLERLTVGS